MAAMAVEASELGLGKTKCVGESEEVIVAGSRDHKPIQTGPVVW